MNCLMVAQNTSTTLFRIIALRFMKWRHGEMRQIGGNLPKYFLPLTALCQGRQIWHVLLYEQS